MEFLKDPEKLLLDELILHRKLIYQQLITEKDLSMKREIHRYLKRLDDRIAEKNHNKSFTYDEI